MIGQLLLNGIVAGSGYALIAVGHTVIFGLMRVSNFAHGELYMLGAFLAYTLVAGGLGLNYYAGLISAVVLTMGLGALMERYVLRRIRGEPLVVSALITIGISIFLMNMARMIWGAAPKTIPSPLESRFSIVGVLCTGSRLFVVVVAALVIAFLHFAIQNTRLGKAFRATFQNRDAALLAGIEVDRVYMLSFAIGAGLAGLAGSLLGMIYTVEPTMGVRAVAVAWAVVVSGGPGSFAGAISVGYLLGILESFAAVYVSSQYRDVVAFSVLILALIFRPQGLFGKRASEMGG